MSGQVMKRGARGGIVMLLGQVFALVTQFIGAVVLARLLMPSDFGIIAMTAVFFGIGGMIRDFGMSTAALQARQLDDQQSSNVFWVSTVLSVGAAILLAASTPLIILVFDEPRLGLVVPAMASVLILTGLQAQFQVRLSRELRFTVQTVVVVASRVVGLAAAIAAASAGWGYWALVLQMAAEALFVLVGSWVASGWIPSRPRRGSNSMHLVRSGAHNGGANLLGYLADNVDGLMIGAIWGAGPLGFYNRAFQLFMRPVMSFFTPLTNVVVPTINRAIAHGRSGTEIMAMAQTVLCGSAMWLLLVTSVTADSLVPWLLGEQWHTIVPLLQILAIGGAFKALSQTNYWVFLIEQKSRELLLSNLVTKPIQIILIIGAAFISVEAVAWAFVIGRAITWPVNVIWLWRTTGQDPWKFGLNGARLLMATGSGYLVATLVLSRVESENPLVVVSVGAAVATVAYACAFASLPGGMRELRASVRLSKLIVRR